MALESEICAASGPTSTPNRTCRAFRMAAQALSTSQTALGTHHRRLCSRIDKPKAITASARKLARWAYFLLTGGKPLSRLVKTNMKSATAKG